MKKINLVRYLAILTTAALVLVLMPLNTSCTPELVFGDLTVCDDIDQETFEPVSQKNEFDIEIKKIYATIQYTGVKGDDNYRFEWKNEDTGEIVLDETLKYSEGESGYFEGYSMSYIATDEDAKVISPGNYKIDFYHNGELESTTNFKVKKPDLNILEVVLADKVDENFAPVNETHEFFSTQIVYACVNTDYYISGNTLEAKWYDSLEGLVVETAENMEVDLYEPVWTAFTLKGEGRDIPAGSYNVEIYLNGSLYGSYDFEVIEERGAADSAYLFSQGNAYSSDSYGVSFSVPDDWTYTESEDADGLEVNLSPSSGNIPVAFLFMASPVDDYPPSSEYKSFADELSSSIASEYNWESSGEVQENELVTEGGIEFKDFIQTFKDQDNNDWAIAIAFIEGDERLYVLFTTVMGQYFSMGESIYFGILDSIELK